MSVIGAQVGRRVFIPRFVTEINATRELAYNDKIDTLEESRFDGRCADKFGNDFHGPQICKYAEEGAQTQQTLLRPNLGIWVGPPRSPDRAENDRVTFLATRYRILRQ